MGKIHAQLLKTFLTRLRTCSNKREDNLVAFLPHGDPSSTVTLFVQRSQSEDGCSVSELKGVLSKGLSSFRCEVRRGADAVFRICDWE